jgi:long-subunit acyl-CoA synthetase (AMP-forming)
MDFQQLLESLRHKSGSLWWLEKGKRAGRRYATLYQDVKTTRQMLTRWGVTTGTRVGLYAPNSWQWLVHDLALIDIGAVSVVFTDDFRNEMSEDLLERHDIELLLTTKAHAKCFPAKSTHIAWMDGENGNVQVLRRSNLKRESDDPDQLTCVFSSGSSGGLKGLVISRKGVMATLPPILDAVGLSRGDCLLLFLPLSNFQQRYLFYGALWYDFDIALTDFMQLFGAIQTLHPTILLAPPVFFQMFHAEHLNKPRWQRWWQDASGTLLSLLPSAKMRRALGRRIFRDFHAKFGHHIRMLITGMAPIRPNVLQLFERMQMPLSEAYGMVEVGVMTFRHGHQRGHGSVGRPVRDVRFSFGDDGEIFVHRPHPVTLRYFQSAEGENERTFITPGTIATGDQGQLDAAGRLVIWGRKKEVIALPSGEKVHPEIIERELNGCPDIANSVVFLGHGPHLSCIVSLNNAQDIDAMARVRKLVSGLSATQSAARFMSVVFAPEAFSTENGMLRPNMKIDRRKIVAKYGAHSESRSAHG